jgi:peptide deformylase
MTLLKIATVGDPILRAPTRELSTEELLSPRWQTFIDDMIETMRDADGAGIAAPQVFEPVRIAVIEVRGNNPRYPYKPAIPLTVIVNPKVTPLVQDTFENFEGCLSVPDMRGVVSRFLHVKVDALDRHGKPLHLEARGLTAGTYQHEVDHLDGKLFLDRVTDPTTLCTWKMFEKHHRAAFVERATRIVAAWGG